VRTGRRGGSGVTASSALERALIQNHDFVGARLDLDGFEFQARAVEVSSYGMKAGTALVTGSVAVKP
jgi:hypothetical protein